MFVPLNSQITDTLSGHLVLQNYFAKTNWSPSSWGDQSILVPIIFCKLLYRVFTICTISSAELAYFINPYDAGYEKPNAKCSYIVTSVDDLQKINDHSSFEIYIAVNIVHLLTNRNESTDTQFSALSMLSSIRHYINSFPDQFCHDKLSIQIPFA